MRCTQTMYCARERGHEGVCLDGAALTAANLSTRVAELEQERQSLVEVAVRATIEACVASVYQTNLQAAAKVSNVDPAPIVARVLGGGE